MKKRAKPRENWESVIEVPRKFLKKEDYQKILHKLEIPFNDEIIQKIIDAQKYYYSSLRLINEAPRMSEVGATMRRLIKYGKAYRKCLEKMDDRSREKMAVVMPIPFNLWEILDRNLQDTILVTERAKYVLEDWEISKKHKTVGRPFNLPIRAYISDLAKIFQQATGTTATVTRDPVVDKEIFELEGTPKYKGIFFNLISFCIKKIPQHPILKNPTLGSIIEETLRNPIISYSGSASA